MNDIEYQYAKLKKLLTVHVTKLISDLIKLVFCIDTVNLRKTFNLKYRYNTFDQIQQ